MRVAMLFQGMGAGGQSITMPAVSQEEVMSWAAKM